MKILIEFWQLLKGDDPKRVFTEQDRAFQDATRELSDAVEKSSDTTARLQRLTEIEKTMSEIAGD